MGGLIMEREEKARYFASGELTEPPIVCERFADNGAHSHWDLINASTGETLWSEDKEQVASTI